MNFYYCICGIAKMNKDKVAINTNKEVITYSELVRRIDIKIELLSQYDIEENSRVSLLLNGEVEYITSLFALWAKKCIPIPLDIDITETEMERVLEVSHFLLDNRNGEKLVKLPKNDLEHKKNTCIIFFTSGTTGKPKGVCFSFPALYANVMDVAHKIGIEKGDKCYTPISFSYTAAITTILLPTLLSGASLLVRKTQLPQNIISIANRHKIDVFFAVPYMFELLAQTLENGTGSFHCSKMSISSSAHLSEKLFTRFLNITGLSICTIYCSSEGGAITFNNLKDLNRNMRSVGIPFHNVKVIIKNEEGIDVTQGEIGEVFVSGSHIASGYLGNPDLEKEVFGNGMVKTGDLAMFLEGNILVLKGRVADTINVAGHLVSPDEVEQVLLSHPQVKDALVFGEEQSVIGEVVVAEIVFNDSNNPVTQEELNLFCKSKLSKYKIPKHYFIVKEIKCSKYGKKIRTRK